MAFRHGVYKQEVPTSLLAPVRTESGLPVIVGTAPIHLASDEEAIVNAVGSNNLEGYQTD